MDENSISTKVLDELEAKIKAYDSELKARVLTGDKFCEIVLSVLEPLVEHLCRNATGKWKRVCKILRWIIDIIKRRCETE